MSGRILYIAFVVSLGGFLFGFDAGIISGVMSFAGPEFDLNDMQSGWVVSSPSFAAMLSMLVSGRLSDVIGRKKILIVVALMYAVSAAFSAYATSYEMLYIARMVGGVAFGAALVLAPTYIAEISSSENRGKLVSLQQLNIVLGFFAAFLSNYFFNKFYTEGYSSLTEANVWRWMLGVEFFPAILYFILLFFVPKSPRWLFTKNLKEEARVILEKIYGAKIAANEIKNIEEQALGNKDESKVSLKSLLLPSLRFILIIGLVVGVLQQITGINAVYFYATSIFKQTGIGNDASFSSGVLLSTITVIFTFVAIATIDKMGRRPLLLIGIAGVAISLIVCAFGFYNASYELKSSEVDNLVLNGITTDDLSFALDKKYDSDLEFKNVMKENLGNQLYAKNEGAILEAATNINSTLVLVGIMAFIACFAFSLGPVMWVLLSELYPIKYRGAAIGVIGFVNSFTSWVVQQVFPWELSNFGNALTFLIFGLIALVGFFILMKILPETKGKSLEELEAQLVK
ncbi:MAG: sugar porter family MFS transporter [Bacteroidia bacterium]